MLAALRGHGLHRWAAPKGNRWMATWRPGGSSSSGGEDYTGDDDDDFDRKERFGQRPQRRRQNEYNKRMRRGSHQSGSNEGTGIGSRRVAKDPDTGLFPGNSFFMLVGKMPNSGLVPLELRDEIWRLYTTDPDGKGDINRMSSITGLPVPKIQGIIKLRQFEKDYERDELGGEPLDQTPDKEARAIFGEMKNFKGMFNEDQVKLRLTQGKNEYVFYDDEEEVEGKDDGPKFFIDEAFKPWKQRPGPQYGEKVRESSGLACYSIPKTAKDPQNKRKARKSLKEAVAFGTLKKNASRA